MDINYSARFVFFKALCHMLSRFINCFDSQEEIRTLQTDSKAEP